MKQAYRRTPQGTLRRLYKRVGGVLRWLGGCCCGTTPGDVLYFVAVACHSLDRPKPANLPWQILFRDILRCDPDNCPPAGNQIVRYEGWCYVVRPDYTGRVDECGRTNTSEPPSALRVTFPYYDFPIVTGVRCQPLEVTCYTSPCQDIDPTDCCYRGRLYVPCYTDPPPSPRDCNCQNQFMLAVSYATLCDESAYDVNSGQIPPPLYVTTHSATRGSGLWLFNTCPFPLPTALQVEASAEWIEYPEYPTCPFPPFGYNRSGTFNIEFDCGLVPAVVSDGTVATQSTGDCSGPARCVGLGQIICEPYSDSDGNQRGVVRNNCSGGIVSGTANSFDSIYGGRTSHSEAQVTWQMIPTVPCTPGPSPRFAGETPRTFGLLDITL